MSTIQTTLQTIWASLLLLGLLKVIIIVVFIGILSRLQRILGITAAIIFITYLAHWI